MSENESVLILIIELYFLFFIITKACGYFINEYKIKTWKEKI